MFTGKFSNISFTSLKTNIAVMRKIASDERCQNAYTKLMQRAQGKDILLETYKEDGAKVSIIGPLDSDIVEISKNPDFVQGIEDAINIIDKNDTHKKEDTDYIDLDRFRVIGFSQN